MKWRVPEVLLGGLIVLAAAVVGWSLRAIGVGSQLIVTPPLLAGDSENEIAFWTMALSVFTLVLGIATILLFVETRRTTAHAVQTSVRQLRAYVCPGGIRGLFNPNSAGGFEWALTVAWENTGVTPTHGMHTAVFSMFADSPLPIDHLFEYTWASEGTGLLAPHATTTGGQLPSTGRMSPEQVADLVLGRRFLYVWGWCRYNDGFDGTPQRVSRLAYFVTVAGDPFNFDPLKDPNSVRWSFVQMRFGNDMDIISV